MFGRKRILELERDNKALRTRPDQEVKSADLWQMEAWRLYLHKFWYDEATKDVRGGILPVREMIQADIQPVYGWTPEWGQWWWDSRFTRGRSE